MLLIEYLPHPAAATPKAATTTTARTNRTCMSFPLYSVLFGSAAGGRGLAHADGHDPDLFDAGARRRVDDGHDVGIRDVRLADQKQRLVLRPRGEQLGHLGLGIPDQDFLLVYGQPAIGAVLRDNLPEH